MAVYERPDNYTDAFSKRFATGIGNALQKLSASKIHEINRQKQAMGLEQLGYSPEEAQGITSQHPDIQKEIIRDQFNQNKAAQVGNRKIVSEVLNQAKSATTDNAILDRIEQLDKTGKVEGFGGRLKKKIGLGDYRSKETQEVEKLSASLVNDVKSIFGSRPAVKEVELYMLGLPNLMQSAEGRKAASRVIRLFNSAKQQRAEVLKQILKDNKGRTPNDLEIQLDEAMAPILDEITREVVSAEAGGSATNQSFDQLPDPRQYVGTGKELYDNQTGQTLVSNGSEWVPKGR